MTAHTADIAILDTFLEYEGDTIYRTYQFEDPVSYPPSSHIFTTSPDGTYATDPFRIRPVT